MENLLTEQDRKKEEQERKRLEQARELQRRVDYTSPTRPDSEPVPTRKPSWFARLFQRKST